MQVTILGSDNPELPIRVVFFAPDNRTIVDILEVRKLTAKVIKRITNHSQRVV